MKLNGLFIENTFAEAFNMKASRIIVTADNFKWAKNAAISFTGFADVWNDGQTTVWMSEPQIWYSLGKLSVGGEVEISQNFVYGAGEDIQIMPTLGLKWEF